MTDMGSLRRSRLLKILFMFVLTITPILASGRQFILLLEDDEVKEGAQGELGGEDNNSLESGVIKEDSDEWDEFGDMEDRSVDELDPGSWRKILEKTLSPDNISSTEEGLYISAVNKMMFSVSEGETELMKEAISDLHLAAQSGYAHAQSTLGFLYDIGSGVEQSDAKAFLYHHFAAEGGNFQSKMALAYTYFRLQVYEKSVKLYAELASVAVTSFFSFEESPLFESVRINYGAEENKEALRKSRGEEDDDFQILEYQAQKGSAVAMYRLGIFYYFGLRGVRREHGKALSWFLRAVEKGDANSMEFLGEMYARGSGVERNFTRALEWFTAASRRKRYSAYNGIGYLYMKGHGVEKKNYSMAREFFKKAAENDDLNGHGNYNLGVLYLKGLGVKKHIMLAYRYFITAANAGQPKALYQLAKMYHEGIGLKKDLKMEVPTDYVERMQCGACEDAILQGPSGKLWHVNLL